MGSDEMGKHSVVRSVCEKMTMTLAVAVPVAVPVPVATIAEYIL